MSEYLPDNVHKIKPIFSTFSRFLVDPAIKDLSHIGTDTKARAVSDHKHFRDASDPRKLFRISRSHSGGRIIESVSALIRSG